MSQKQIETLFIIQKLMGTPNLVGIGHQFGPQIRIWKDLGPVWLSFKEILLNKSCSENSQ